MLFRSRSLRCKAQRKEFPSLQHVLLKVIRNNLNFYDPRMTHFLFLPRSQVADAEFKKIGSFPSVTVIVCCTLLSAVILLVIAVVVWRYGF